jgi:Fe-Mn family superoxide dismutase
VISANTLRIHYGKHYKGYVDQLNKLVAGTPLADLSLEEVVLATAGKPEHTEVFHNAAQAWNHAFYWRSLTPKGSVASAALKARIDASFGSAEARCRHRPAEIVPLTLGTAVLLQDFKLFSRLHALRPRPAYGDSSPYRSWR